LNEVPYNLQEYVIQRTLEGVGGDTVKKRAQVVEFMRELDKLHGLSVPHQLSIFRFKGWTTKEKTMNLNPPLLMQIKRWYTIQIQLYIIQSCYDIFLRGIMKNYIL